MGEQEYTFKNISDSACEDNPGWPANCFTWEDTKEVSWNGCPDRPLATESHSSICRKSHLRPMVVAADGASSCPPTYELVTGCTRGVRFDRGLTLTPDRIVLIIGPVAGVS